MSVFPSYNKPDLTAISQALRTQGPARAKAQVEGMLQSGQLSQARFDQLAKQASQIMGMLNIK